MAELLRIMDRRPEPLDLRNERSEWAEDIMSAYPEYYREYRMRFVFPLESGGQLVGVITLNDDRVGKAPLTAEDQELLHAYGTQLAARVLQFRLLDRLRHAQEVELFQNAAAFFVHDLKNLASRLSLTMQNLPAHFDNPEFRADALKLIGESLAKIESTCERLSSLKQNVELKTREIDLNALVAGILDALAPGLQCQLDKDLKPLPAITADAEQLQKVVTNLVLNAYEAVDGHGRIVVATEVAEKHVVLSVKDSGCGMSARFIEQTLFRPFRSTKKRGMGIGLFHSRMIVEAHQGRIEVVSEEGAGSTFRVILPRTAPQAFET